MTIKTKERDVIKNMQKVKKKLVLILGILMLISIVKIVVVNAEGVNNQYIAKTYIDYPVNCCAGGNIVVEGWIMTNDKDANIKAYLDNSDNEIEILSQTKTERADVLEAIKGYGTAEQNKLPGIRLVLNTENISNGRHNLIVKVLSRENNVIAESSSNFEYENEKAKMYIDTIFDNNTIYNNYKIEGWMMSNDVNSKLKIWIDDIEQDLSNLTRVERTDVLKAIKGYGTKVENPLPGFEYYLNLEDVTDGSHTLKIEVVSGKEENEESLAQYTKEIIVEKYKAKTYIDYPTNNELAGNFEFEGWIMTNDEKATYKLFIDNEEQKNVKFERVERTDVLNGIKGYGTEKENPLPGIKCKINTENMELRNHNITLIVYSREGNILSQQSKNFILEESKAKIYIDEPLCEEVSTNVKIEGWLMSNDKYADIKVYIDGLEQQITNYTREERGDVIEAIKGYGTEKENSLPGFKTDIDLSNFSNGEHNLKIEGISSSGKTIAVQEKKIYLDKYETKIYIDSPIKNQIVKTTLELDGWIMSSGENSDIEVYIDDQKIDDIKITRKEREDVIEAIKGYGTEKENPTPGFEAIIDTSHLLEGKHTLKILANINGEETRKLKTVDFIVNKYNTKMYIDEPSQKSVRRDTLKISGWAMSELANKKIIIKIDDNIINDITYNERTDVINAIKGYGGINENPTPGFETTVDIKSYSKGTHTIKIQVYSNETNEIIQELQQNIIFLGKIEREIITYGYSGAYLRGVSDESILTCYKYGDGPNVLFATFCVHGYEDSWERDGGVLVDIANAFYNRLIAEQDYALAEKWTIYLFPEVNPDGRKLGTTNYGPGRRTLYSKAAEGIDINRSWQTGSKYKRFTDKRNYNGTAGFQAYEAEYLRDFMLTHKSTTGQNVVIDLHGWENQLIGDESICKYYKEQYQSCSTRNYGSYGEQYLISWAHLNLNAKVALVELPYAANYEQVNSMNLSNKYITATLNFLRGM